ncbi:MAG: helix-turn-helix transcriptional regulator [Myxococcales bacterium]|nr:helix-turn-helix transcriptional regulator [Myxococcales bacterium]MCB9524631.1 helix-turn-helix transcriptional regulator [Myxococcales bacterium]
MTDLLNTLVLLGAFQGFGLALALTRRRVDHLASRVLGALVGAVSLMLLLAFAEARWALQGHPGLIAVGSPLPYLFNPLLCLYVLALTRPIERFDPRWLVHALPFLAYLAYMTQAFYSQPADRKLALMDAHLRGDIQPGMHAFLVLQVLQAVGYLSVALVALRRHARRMAGYYSELSHIDLRWLMAVVAVNAFTWGVVALQYAAAILTDVRGNTAEPLVQLLSAGFVFLIGYLFLWQPELMPKARAAHAAEAPRGPTTVGAPAPHVRPPGEAQPAVEVVKDPAPAPRYERNRLDTDEAAELVAGLQRLMEVDERFRDAALTLQDLADALPVSAHSLSQVLNVHIGCTFHAFVNGHRAEALKRALADPAQAERTILDLAFEAGFGSKSTLNSAFKRHVGVTPSQYRRQALAGP